MTDENQNDNSQNESQNNQDTLLEFPCEFNVKAVGIHENKFDLLVIEIVSNHLETYTEYSVSTRKSSNGKYLSVTVNITAVSKAQLDAIYTELSGHDRVTMAL